MLQGIHSKIIQGQVYNFIDGLSGFYDRKVKNSKLDFLEDYYAVAAAKFIRGMAVRLGFIDPL